MQTGEIVGDIYGDKPYQRLAHQALPILINYARAGRTLTYQSMALRLDESGIHEGAINPRNINRIAGSVAATLNSLAARRNEAIPPLTVLIVNKQTGQPSDGFDYFLEHHFGINQVPEAKRLALVKTAQQEVFDYPGWTQVLEDLDVEPVILDPDSEATAEAGKELGRGGGEGPEHQRLKHYIGENPDVVGLRKVDPPWYECILGSGDRLDIFFESASQWIAVEVKSRISSDADVLRGLYQCVKYRALLEAEKQAAAYDGDVRSVLVLEGALNTQNRQLMELFGIEVFENINPTS